MFCGCKCHWETIYSSCLGTLYKKNSSDTLSKKNHPRRNQQKSFSPPGLQLWHLLCKTYEKTPNISDNIAVYKDKISTTDHATSEQHPGCIPFCCCSCEQAMSSPPRARKHCPCMLESRASSLRTAAMDIICIPTTLVILGLWERPSYTLKRCLEINPGSNSAH